MTDTGRKKCVDSDPILMDTLGIPLGMLCGQDMAEVFERVGALAETDTGDGKETDDETVKAEL